VLEVRPGWPVCGTVRARVLPTTAGVRRGILAEACIPTVAAHIRWSERPP
jgi:hypothetical protein